MILRQFNKSEFLDYLNRHGFNVSGSITSNNPKYPLMIALVNHNDESMIIIDKDTYMFTEVCTLCDQFDIPIPDEFLLPWNQINNYPN